MFLSISLALCFIDVVGAVPMVVALSVCWRLLFVGALLLLLALVDGVVVLDGAEVGAFRAVRGNGRSLRSV